ncbi:MAG: hypothetical protein ACT4TC_21850 [Myxococcaceae bacterium]
MRWFFVACLLVGCGSKETRIAGVSPPLAALLIHEETLVRADGVTQVNRYQEKFVRAGDRVWLERVLPRAPQQLDLERLPRLITRGADGELSLQYAFVEQKQWVDVPASEFDAVGFDSDWSTLSQLFPSEALRQLSSENRHERGGEWLALKEETGSVRILWSDALALALQAQSERKDGSVSRKLLVQIQPAPTVMPWEHYDAFEHRSLDAFRD